MKKILGLILIFLCSFEITFAIEEVVLDEKDILQLNVETAEKQEKTEALANKNKPLLYDYLHHEFSEGAIRDITFFGAYQGSVSANFFENDYSTTYQNGFADVGIVGNFREQPLDFKIMFNTRQLDNMSYLQGFISDLYIATNAIPHHRVLIGNSRTPIGVEGGSSSYTLPFVSRSQISRNFGNVRAKGIKVIGTYDFIDYNLGIYNSDRFFRDFFPGVEFTGWINLYPLAKTNNKYGKLTIGGGLNAGHNDFNYTVAGAYVGYEYKKLTLNFEAAIADGYNGSVGKSQNKASGFYSTVAYKLTDKIQLLARYDQFNPNRELSGNIIKEYTAGVNYFIKGDALRLILNYIYRVDPNSQNSNRILFATQVLL